MLAILSAPGCGEPAPSGAPTRERSEATLVEQTKAVREGRADTVRLDHTLVRDEDLAPLADTKSSLRHINFSHTEITDAGLARICESPALEQLRLSSPRVTDAGLAHIARLKHLRFLHLLGMPITDAGLDRLHPLTSLESLYLDDTRVTDAGLARLIKALPRVHLHIDERHHPLDPHADDHTH
jgi:hypothetical protein